jgi:predicted metal-binding membrane protein
MTLLEAVLRRDRAVVVAALAVMTAFAWCYILWLTADIDMGGMDMDGFRMIPAGIAIMAPASAPRSAMELALVFAMWAVMMVGMMMPSTASGLRAQLGQRLDDERKAVGQVIARPAGGLSFGVLRMYLALA